MNPLIDGDSKKNLDVNAAVDVPAIIAIKRPAYSFAKRHGILIDERLPNGVRVLYKKIPTPALMAELNRFIGEPLIFEAAANNFDQLLAQRYDRGKEGAQASLDDMGDEMDLAQIAETLSEPEDLLESQDDAPIIRLLNALLSQAIKENASDIHIETFETRLLVRMRIDGVLREILEPPRSLAPLIISRVKIMAKLDIAEKRLPQDGRISLKVGGRAVDVRVSTLPSGYGERVVMRLLDKQAGRLNLIDLGMAAETLERIQQIIHKPHGIFLVTGPTGSGKTTTLYSALTQLNDLTRNILTVEDPIEYYLDGIGQTQVNTKVDLTFARGLRAILRQDPDVVMVGEIRDLETAEISVQASLTGHMVFSTLHTNTAVGAVTRLRDMGVEPFLLSSTLIGVLAQRLVRTLCVHCKQAHTPTEAERILLGINSDHALTIFSAQGCQHCSNSGYSGRMGIHELVLIDNTLQHMIHEGAGEHKLEKHARTRTPSIRQDGIAKVMAGLTSIEEVLRVTKDDNNE
ncbi:MAG: type II secretion system ATPase GspE [Gammaproteobacteria bacterium]|nr:type II secretion system ATPase GspE [Gammaproteobacteria bacterium]